MNGLLVRIRGSRRHWRVCETNGTGEVLTIIAANDPGALAIESERRVRLCDVTARREPGIGWVPYDHSAEAS